MPHARRVANLLLVCSTAIFAGAQTVPDVHQTATRSTCSNIVALSGAKVDCANLTEAQKKALEHIPAILKMAVENQGYLDAILKKLDEMAQTPPPPTVNYAPGGFATNGGTLINPQVNNFAPVDRHLNEAQKAAISSVVQGLPEGVFVQLYTASLAEPYAFGKEIADLIPKVHSKDLLESLEPLSKGIIVAIKSNQDISYPLAQQLVSTMAANGIAVRAFIGNDRVESGTIRILVGEQ